MVDSTMKSLFVLTLVCLSSLGLTQKVTHDLITYSAPAGWKVDKKDATITYSKTDSEKSAFGIITVYKSVEASSDSRKNFDTYWKTLIEESTKAGKPEMQPTATDGGWKIESGMASFQQDDLRGVAFLVSATSNSKAVNIVILSNSTDYHAEAAKFLTSVEFKKIAAAPVVKPSPAVGKFKYLSTTFDDGWVATPEADWVSVTKKGLTVRVHYPNRTADAYDSVLKNQTQKAWNTLVAPHLSDIRDFQIKNIQSFESILFAEANAVDKATGKRSYVVLFKKQTSNGAGKFIEFVTDSKATFEREYMPYRSEEFGWEKLEGFQIRNRFAVADIDLVGKWATSNYASVTYYYVSSGRSAGATATSTADEFSFQGSNQYSSDHSGASGMVGNQKFSRQVYKGKYTANQWKLNLTNRFQGQAENYDCHFEAVKGGRVLVLRDRLNTNFYLVKR